MKKKVLPIIFYLLLSSTLLVGCNVKFGINSRRDINENPGFNVNSIFKNNLSINSINNNLNNNVNTPLYDENINDSISMDGIKTVNISILASNVTIKSIDGKAFTLLCSGPSSIVKSTTFEKKGTNLNIQENGSMSNLDVNNLPTSYGRKVIIGIPKSFMDDIIVNSNAGTITIDSITSNNLDINGGVGSLTINDAIFKDLKLKQVIGTTNISLKNKCGNMNISGLLGEVVINLSEIGGNLSYSGGCGKTTINIPNNSPVKVNTNANIGNANVNVRTSGEDTYIFDLNIEIGDLTVN
ncbi:MAG: DUF4097 family beta strand repeat-containing protein [Clostridium sp.]|uniref:DUF4097 family beta strand repeat-containing protein n=1 Tax=Clostridium sp. TaxID=1506 RepID=UPI00306E781B